MRDELSYPKNKHGDKRYIQHLERILSNQTEHKRRIVSAIADLGIEYDVVTDTLFHPYKGRKSL